MPIHDEYARITPYELLLPQEDFADRRFPLIQKEAEEREADLSNPERFPLLSEAGSILRDLRGEDDDPRLIHQFGILLFHAFHFWSRGQPFFFLDTGVVRYLVDSGPESETWTTSLPARAGYVQLPQHLIWTPGEGEAPAESLDGFFWSAVDGENLSLLLALGLRKDRPGLSVVPLPNLPIRAAAEWASMQVRPTGGDFQSSLPGSELENLYGIESGGEAVKMAMRVFWYLDTFPGSVSQGIKGTKEEGGPRPSSLEARRIVLREG